MDHWSKWADEVIMAYRDDDRVVGGKVLWYYPIMQRSKIRNQRSKNIARTVGVEVPDEHLRYEELRITVNDPAEDVVALLKQLQEQPIGYYPYGNDDDGEEEVLTS